MSLRLAKSRPKLAGTRGFHSTIKRLSLREFAHIEIGCNFFAYSWKLPAYSGAFYLQLTILALWLTIWSFFAYSFSFFTYNWSFLAYSGKVRRISALKNCKQRSLPVSKQAPTVSKIASPNKGPGLQPTPPGPEQGLLPTTTGPTITTLNRVPGSLNLYFFSPEFGGFPLEKAPKESFEARFASKIILKFSKVIFKRPQRPSENAL